MRAWFKRFSVTIKKFHYQQGESDHTMFTKHAKDGKKSVLIVYLDGMIITGDDITEVEDLKKHLRAEFEVEDLGTLRYLLGMEVARSK